MRFKAGGILAALILAAALAGGWVGGRAKAGDASDGDLDALLKRFTEVLATVQSNYAQEVDSSDLMESAVDAMLSTLDPHSSYFSQVDYGELQEEQSGQYFGLGILIRPERPGSGRVVVVEPPAEGTPGYKAGLRPGDVIFRIDGQPIEDWVYPDEIIPRLKGPKGTKVVLGVERPGESEPIRMEVVRDAIPLYSIKYAFHIRPKTGFIRIERFAESTSEELGRALDSLEESKLEGLILDLRGNPGGSLGQAIEVADRFLERDQVIVSTRDREGVGNEYLAPRGRRHDYPMVVLIDGHSASASEIVAGALQDHDRALILGENSFGKALVQTVFPLRGERGLALTTGKYYTPSNRLIQRPYQGGLYDYMAGAPSGRGSEQGRAFRTDGGRAVYGGGGIAPDVEEPIGRLSRLAAMAVNRNLPYEFAGLLARGEVPSFDRFHFSEEEKRRWSEEEREKVFNDLRITGDDPLMEAYAEFLRERGLEFSQGEFDESRALLANRVRREVFVMLFGEREGMRVQLEIDNQVQKAIEILPSAGELFQRSKTD